MRAKHGSQILQEMSHKICQCFVRLTKQNDEEQQCPFSISQEIRISQPSFLLVSANYVLSANNNNNKKR